MQTKNGCESISYSISLMKFDTLLMILTQCLLGYMGLKFFGKIIYPYSFLYLLVDNINIYLNI